MANSVFVHSNELSLDYKIYVELSSRGIWVLRLSVVWNRSADSIQIVFPFYSSSCQLSGLCGYFCLDFLTKRNMYAVTLISCLIGLCALSVAFPLELCQYFLWFLSHVEAFSWSIIHRVGFQLCRSYSFCRPGCPQLIRVANCLPRTYFESMPLDLLWTFRTGMVPCGSNAAQS